MTGVRVTSFAATTYVRDLERSLVFYRALGFEERSAGHNASSGWSYLHHGEHLLLLVTSQPPLDVPALPLLFYFFVEDLDLATRSLESSGSTVEHVGYPPHAPGGEARTRDPDGNTVLVGQPVASSTQTHIPEQDPSQRFSLLREAAALAGRHRGTDMSCQIHNARDEPCTKPAEVKLADSWGDTAWACIQHADEVLVRTSSAFIASQDDEGLAVFLAHRRSHSHTAGS